MQEEGAGGDGWGDSLGEQKNLEPGGTWWEASGHSGRTLRGVWAGLGWAGGRGHGQSGERLLFGLPGYKETMADGFLLGSAHFSPKQSVQLPQPAQADLMWET